MKYFYGLCFLLFFMWPVLVMAGKGPTLTLTKQANMNFGSVEYDATYNGTVRLGTNGAVTVTGSGLVASGVTQAGEARVTNATSGNIEIRCSTTGKLKESGNNILNLVNTEIVINSGVAFGSGSACQGDHGNDPVTLLVDTSANPNPTIFVGGEVQIPSSVVLPPFGEYSTNTGGGKAVTLDVVFQ